jgi:hypothetical protein
MEKLVAFDAIVGNCPAWKKRKRLLKRCEPKQQSGRFVGLGRDAKVRVAQKIAGAMS